MADGLNTGRLIRVTVDIAPLAASRRGFGIGLAIGDSDVISGQQRIQEYASLEEIAIVFGVLSPEYSAALLYFSQNPKPNTLFIGRWLRTPTSGFLNGGVLTPAEQDIALWDVIADGTTTIPVDGVPQDIIGADLTLETNLNGVASVLSGLLAGGAITWDGERFKVTSDSTGVISTVGYAVPEGSGTDLSTMLKLTVAETQATPVPGFDAETPLEATVALAAASNDWYASGFASSVPPNQTEYEDVSSFIQASLIKRTFWITSDDVNILDNLITTDLASSLKALGRTRTLIQYSDNLFAGFSAMARLITTNFTANNSTITLMYKQEPSVVPTVLTTQQANTLQFKRCNVFAQYDNNTAIIQYGVMSGDAYADEIIGIDWLADAVQNANYNLLYQTKTKIPQTDAGQNQLVNACSAVLNEAVNNGLIGAGQWNGDSFGQLETGDFLDSGFYIYSPPMALQNQAIREQRIAQTIQIAAKFTGAIHEADILINVNR